jgi:SAM-dependent methyltransferase
MCGFRTGARILDVGCGIGASVKYMREQHQFRALGIDVSYSLFRKAGGADTIPFAGARAEALPFPDSCCDGILCECVLSLIAEKQAVLREFYRVLRPGGLLILSDIYSRRESGSGDAKGISVSCCSGRSIVSRPIESLLKEIGLDVSLCEDHTYLLRELAARLVFECGSLDAFWSEISGALNCGDVKSMLAGSRPGYYLLVARKD